MKTLCTLFFPLANCEIRTYTTEKINCTNASDDGAFKMSTVKAEIF